MLFECKSAKLVTATTSMKSAEIYRLLTKTQFGLGDKKLSRIKFIGPPKSLDLSEDDNTR